MLSGRLTLPPFAAVGSESDRGGVYGLGAEWPANTALLRWCRTYVNPTEMECRAWVLSGRLTPPSFASVASK